MASDVNENKLNEEDCLTKKEDLTHPSNDAQDSINNNENCNVMCGQLSCKKGCEDNGCTVMDSMASAPLATKENPATKGKRVTGRRNSRNKKSNNGKCTGLATNADVTLTEDLRLVESAYELPRAESNECTEHRSQKQLRNSLFSLIRDGFEQTDNIRVLPTCLHQIAETYFLEEDYEKAIQFIQLERIYHEQLLANLSAIQEQWETKWKTTKSVPLTSAQNSEKDLGNKELERLSGICSSHQQYSPQLPSLRRMAAGWPDDESTDVTDNQARAVWYLAPEKYIQTSTHLEGTTDKDAPFPHCPDRSSELGIRAAADRKPGVAVMTENLPPEVSTSDSRNGGADNQAFLSHSHKEEQQQSISEATLEIHTQPTGTGGRADPDSSFSSGNAGRNNNLLQPEATSSSTEVSKIETLSKEGEEQQDGIPITDKLISTATTCSDSVSRTQDHITEGRSSFDCRSAGTDDAANRDGVTSKESIIVADNKVGDLGQPSECSADRTCSEESQTRTPHQTAVEFIASLLNGDLKDSESLLAHLEFHEEAFSEEEMSPSPGESVLGESFISLDELAKRIEIEEVSPAAGLVSILKKHNGREGEKLSQSSQKPTKRKVRFEETDDALDQEEIGGGSCILLVALCIATVFLSIGGTALYCAFGDVDSSVCKDFAANMDFYYTQAVQGIDELRHWLFVT
ncbi:consortin [Gastrophryne carolinensis]